MKKPKIPKVKSNIGFGYQDDPQRPRAKKKKSKRSSLKIKG